jgi:hypothetical protein
MTLTFTDVDLFQALKEKLGKIQAKMLTEFIEIKVDRKFDDRKSDYASKQDIYDLRSDMYKLIIGSVLGIVISISGIMFGMMYFLLKFNH